MIDWDRVIELREEVGAEDFLEVAELFLSEVAEVLERLSGGVNVATLENDMHFLKGAALNLGFRDFSELCRQGEMRAAASDFGSVDIPAVMACFSASKDSFVAGLAQRMAS
ncbi:MAG: Hpt domain-containing protein [Paracoccaceae bacterium]|nr:Hpt domain-containing protein [Paracoccaceae bacterium]